MRISLVSVLSIVFVACGAHSRAPSTAQPVAQRSPIVDLHARTAQIMEVGDAQAADGLYAEDALLVLTNGKVHRGRTAIRAVIEGAPALAFRNAHFENVQADVLEKGAYVEARFAFQMTLPGGRDVRPQGHRLTMWQPTADGGWTIKVDVWVPDRPTPEAPVAEDIASRIEALEAAYNAHDPRTALALFDPEAVFVLSDASVIEGGGARNMLDFAFGAGLRDMQLFDVQMVDAAEAVMVASRFGLELGTDQPKRISGCRLDVWTRKGQEWKLLLELARPADARSCRR